MTSKKQNHWFLVFNWFRSIVRPFIQKKIVKITSCLLKNIVFHFLSLCYRIKVCHLSENSVTALKPRKTLMQARKPSLLLLTRPGETEATFQNLRLSGENDVAENFRQKWILGIMNLQSQFTFANYGWKHGLEESALMCFRSSEV